MNHSAGLQSVVYAKPRAGRDFIATKLSTRHKKCDYIGYNVWDDLDYKDRSKDKLCNSIKDNAIKFNR